MSDLLDLTAQLVDIPSVSHQEAALAHLVEARLRACPSLSVKRIGDSVIARTDLGLSERVLLGGHLDTVPRSSASRARVEGDTLWGLGAVDMKGGLAVLLDLAERIEQASMDVTFLFYACEEVERDHNALGKIASSDPQILSADAAVLCEPTWGFIEAGCQGTMRLEVTKGGKRAHTARPYTGVNAIHRLSAVVASLERFEPRHVVIDGCEYVEQLQAVSVSGGVAGNVLPDRASITVNYRFAPDRDLEHALAAVTEILDVGDHYADDEIKLVDAAAGAPPSLSHPVIGRLVELSKEPPRAKVGWTDVATFWEMGIPATNFGPGNPLLAHTPDEHVSAHELQVVSDALRLLVLG